MLQPYIGSATAFSYFYYARISGFCLAAEMIFQRLSGPRNVLVDFKYVVLCL